MKYWIPSGHTFACRTKMGYIKWNYIYWNQTILYSSPVSKTSPIWYHHGSTTLAARWPQIINRTTLSFLFPRNWKCHRFEFCWHCPLVNQLHLISFMIWSYHKKHQQCCKLATISNQEGPHEQYKMAAECWFIERQYRQTECFDKRSWHSAVHPIIYI